MGANLAEGRPGPCGVAPPGASRGRHCQGDPPIKGRFPVGPARASACPHIRPCRTTALVRSVETMKALVLKEAPDIITRLQQLRGRGSEMDRRNREAMEEEQVLPAMGRRAEGRARSAPGVRGPGLGTVTGAPPAGLFAFACLACFAVQQSGRPTRIRSVSIRRFRSSLQSPPGFRQRRN